MVTEFGMSDRIGPRAWGTSGPVFLGEDIAAHREFSEETSRLIDDEVEILLRAGEDSCRELLGANRRALDLIAQRLLEEETISGAEVSRLIRVANGTEPDVPSPTAPRHAPAAHSQPGNQNPGAELLPPPIPPHLQPSPRTARGEERI